MRKLSFSVLCLLSFSLLQAQTGTGIGTNSPHASSVLDVASSNKGMLIPRMPSSQRKTIGSPAPGLMVYDLTTKSPWYYDGGWKEIATAGNADSNFVFKQGTAGSYNISSGLMVTDSAGFIFDTGGPDGGYGNSENITMDLNFLPGSQLCRIEITSLNTQAIGDSVIIYNGNSYNAFSGTLSNKVLYFGYSLLPINIRFVSNASVTQAGFKIKFDHYFGASSNTTNLANTLTGFYYIPEKNAIRGGLQANNNWFKDSVGMHSFSYGSGTIAKGAYAQASGINTSATGIAAMATGSETNAIGDFSLAAGNSTTASGIGSASFGGLSEAGGAYATATGLNTIARGYATTAIGTFNNPIIGANETSPSSVTPLLIVGNGSSNASRSNAFVVQKNGNLAVTGYMSKTAANYGIQMLDSGAVRIVTHNFINGFPTASVGERFKFDPWGGFVAKGILGIGNIPATGEGERMMWHPYKAAFRAGSVGSSGTHWDDINVGFYTAAFGFNTRAIGLGGFSVGYQSSALGSYSMAMGYTALADGTGAIAIGYRTTADADYSIAIGHRASVDGRTGALVLSDASTTDSTLATANNQFSARYAGGYRFFSNATRTVGVSVAAGGSSWASISDSNRKENYAPVVGESFLSKLPGLRLGSWNYKGQSPETFRHYGPMAQEIFSAYGKDKYGTIGCDTLLASADIDGIMMIMLQALEKRTALQQKQIDELQVVNEKLRQEANKTKEQDAKISKLEADIKKLVEAVGSRK